MSDQVEKMQALLHKYQDVIRTKEGSKKEKIVAALMKYAAPRGRGSFLQFVYSRSRTFSKEMISICDRSAVHDIQHLLGELNSFFQSRQSKTRINEGRDFHGCLRAITTEFDDIRVKTTGLGDLLTLVSKKDFPPEKVRKDGLVASPFQVASVVKKDMISQLFIRLTCLLKKPVVDLDQIKKTFSEVHLIDGASNSDLAAFSDPKTGDNLLHALVNFRDAGSAEEVKKVISFLVEKGVNLNSRNAKGDTALLKASRLGQTDIANFLLFTLGAEMDPKQGASKAAHFGKPYDFMDFDDKAKTTKPIPTGSAIELKSPVSARESTAFRAITVSSYTEVADEYLRLRNFESERGGEHVV